MRIDRPSGRPDGHDEVDEPKPTVEPVRQDRSRYELRDDNGMTAAELRFLRNQRIKEASARSSEADHGDEPRRSVVTDAQGRTGAEIRFQEAKRAEEAAKADEAAGEKLEPGSESDDRPESDRGWRTITEDLGGEAKSWHSYKAAKRELGPVPGTHVHHIVEQSQADPKRSGFPVERINHSDNMTRIPIDVHQRITAVYNGKALGSPKILRDMLDGLPWEEQDRIGRRELDRQFRREREHDE
jgi:hypothetical protein